MGAVQTDMVAFCMKNDWEAWVHLTDNEDECSLPMWGDMWTPVTELIQNGY